MLNIYRKLFSLVFTAYQLSFPTPPLSKCNQLPVSQIKKLLKEKTPRLYVHAQTKINAYIENAQTCKTNFLSKNLLWRFAFRQKTFVSLDALLKHDQKLLSIFKDPQDLLHFSASSGFSSTLDFFCKDDNRFKLLQRFTLTELFTIMNTDGSKYALENLIDSQNWKTLTEVYKFDSASLVKIASRTGARRTLDCLLNPDNWKTLTEVYKFDLSTIIKITKHDGARNVLDCLLNPDNWKTLTEFCKLDSTSIIRIANHNGAKNVFDILLDPEKWRTLTEIYKFDVASIIKIANSDGSKVVFDILLDSKNWKTLTKTYKFETHEIIKITSHNGARNTLKCLLNPKNCHLLTKVYKFDSKSITKIANNNGSTHTFDTLLNPENWKTLTEVMKLDLPSIVKIGNHQGARSIFNILLNLENWETLTKTYKLDVTSIIRIANNGGSKDTLNTLLNLKNWKTLTETYKLDTLSIVKISSHLGAHQVFTILLDPEKWRTLTEDYKFDLASIVKIANHDGAAGVFDILLNPKKWRALTEDYKFHSKSIVKMANTEGAKNVFDTLLNPKKWKIFTETYHLDLDSIVKIGKHGEARTIFDSVLNADNWKILTQTYNFKKSAIISIACNEGSRDVFNCLLDPKKWKTLTEICNFDSESITKIASHMGAINVLNIFLNPQNWQFLTQTMGLDIATLVLIANQKNAYTVLKLLLSPSKYSEFFSVLDKKTLTKYATSNHLSCQLSTFLQHINDFRLVFDDTWMGKILSLPSREQRGLVAFCTSPHKKNHSFSQRDLFILSKIAGRHLLHIFDIVHSHPDLIHSLFSEYALPLLGDDKQQSLYSFHPFNVQDLKILTLAEFHHFCLAQPLFIDDLKFLAELLPHNLIKSKRMSYLKHLILITSNSSPKKRLSIWKTLLKRDWMNPDNVADGVGHWLIEFPYPVREWFILEGFEHIQNILNFAPLSSSLTNRDQQYLLYCLTFHFFRTYLQQTFDDKLSTAPLWITYNHTVLTDINGQTRISTNSGLPITLFNWFHLTIWIFTIIGSKTSFHNMQSKTNTSLESHFLGDQDRLSLKKKYPTFFWERGIIYTSLTAEQLQVIFFEFTRQIPPPQSNHRKRTVPFSSEPSPKKTRLGTVSLYDAIEQPLFFNLSFTDDFDEIPPNDILSKIQPLIFPDYKTFLEYHDIDVWIDEFESIDAFLQHYPLSP